MPAAPAAAAAWRSMFVRANQQMFSKVVARRRQRIVASHFLHAIDCYCTLWPRPFGALHNRLQCKSCLDDFSRTTTISTQMLHAQNRTVNGKVYVADCSVLGADYYCWRAGNSPAGRNALGNAGSQRIPTGRQKLLNLNAEQSTLMLLELAFCVCENMAVAQSANHREIFV